jgi:hypothetical protein
MSFMDEDMLGQKLHFDDADLADNRSGFLSPKQERRLAKQARIDGIPGVGCGLIFFGIASIFPIVFTPMIISLKDQILSVVGISLGVIVWGLVWGLVGFGMIQSAFGKPDFTLARVEGPVKIVGLARRSGGEKPRNIIEHELHVGEVTFSIEGDIADLIRQGASYAIYYLESSKRIVSLERL